MARFFKIAVSMTLLAMLLYTLKRIDELWGAKPNTPRGDELDVLMLIVEKYEDEHYAIPCVWRIVIQAAVCGEFYWTNNIDI